MGTPEIYFTSSEPQSDVMSHRHMLYEKKFLQATFVILFSFWKMCDTIFAVCTYNYMHLCCKMLFFEYVYFCMSTQAVGKNNIPAKISTFTVFSSLLKKNYRIPCLLYIGVYLHPLDVTCALSQYIFPEHTKVCAFDCVWHIYRSNFHFCFHFLKTKQPSCIIIKEVSTELSGSAT